MLALLAAPRPALAQHAAPRTADSIIARAIAARGGLARLEAIRTERLIGRIAFDPGAEGVDTVELARPMRVRTTVVMNGKTLVQAYDGRVAWTVNPFQGITTPQVMPPDAAKNVAAGADIDGPLIDYAAKGNRITVAGVDTADGRPAYKLTVTTAIGVVDHYYIDTTSYLQTKWDGARTVNGQAVVFESYFRDYRAVDGVMLPFRIDSDTRGRPGGQHITFEHIALDVPEPDTRFRMPATTSVPHPPR
jgi:hypothetical protein